MINQFSDDTALLLIDVQRGVDMLDHWGGPTGRRNNPGAEDCMKALLDGWRRHGLVKNTKLSPAPTDLCYISAIPTMNTTNVTDLMNGSVSTIANFITTSVDGDNEPEP